MIARMDEEARSAKSSGHYHPYVFLNHCFEEQRPLASYGKPIVDLLLEIRNAVDPRGIFHVLQPGHHKFVSRH